MFRTVPSFLTSWGTLVILRSSMSSCHKLESCPSSVGSSRIPTLLLEEQDRQREQVALNVWHFIEMKQIGWQSKSFSRKELAVKSPWQHKILVNRSSRTTLSVWWWVKQLQTAGAPWTHTKHQFPCDPQKLPLPQASDMPSAHSQYQSVYSSIQKKSVFKLKSLRFKWQFEQIYMYI